MLSSLSSLVGPDKRSWRMLRMVKTSLLVRFSKSGLEDSYFNRFVYTSSLRWLTSRSSSKPYILLLLLLLFLRRLMILFLKDARSGITSSRLSQINNFLHRTTSNCLDKSMLSPKNSSLVNLWRAGPNSIDICIIDTFTSPIEEKDRSMINISIFLIYSSGILSKMPTAAAPPIEYP